MHFTDANGKEFDVSRANILYMTTDMESPSNTGLPSLALTDNEKNIPAWKMKIFDSEGKEVNASTILDSAKEDSNNMPKAIDVLFEATHSGSNRNHFIYSSDSMEEDAQSWMSPFPRPFLKNHDIESEPMGRVVDYSFGQSEINPDRDCINVTYRITDQDAIAKFLDGRYKTMSIGGSLGHIKCGICGKDILKDGQLKFCGHWKGEVYNGQKCLWHGDKIEYREGSSVNSPADDWAQVKKITIVNEKDQDNKDSVPTPKASTTDNDETNIIDNLTNPNGTSTQDSNKPKEPTTEPTQQTKDNEPPADPKDNNFEEKYNTLVIDHEKVKTDLQKALDDYKVLEASNQTLQDELNTANTNCSTAVADLAIANQDCKDTRTQSVKLAVFNKKLMVKILVDYEILTKTLKLEDKETRETELTIKSAKELNDMINNLSFDNTQTTTTVVTVPNPGAMNNNENNVVTEPTDNHDSENHEKVLTVTDIEEKAYEAFTRLNHV